MRSFYTRLVSKVLFPLHERLKGHTTVAIRREMERSQWLGIDEIRERQVERLRGLLIHCKVHVPYYRDVLSVLGLEPTDFQSPQDLQKLPFLTKPIIRENTDRLKADNAVGLARFNTGGSSGEPLIFFIGKERVSHDVAAKWRATRWWGVDIGDPEVVVWGSPIELGKQDHIKAIRDRMLRTTLIPAFEMSEAKLDGFVQEIIRLRPKMLFGYPSALAHIAEHAKKRGAPVDSLGIEVAFVTSERLYDHQKEIIEKGFGCRVANGYGGRDAGFIAHACRHGSMHITAEDIIVEIVDEGGAVLPPGQAGEIVVTHLATREFPFIRYRTGDVAVLDDHPCGCGRGLPVLKEIQGRTTDFVVAADGTVMHGLALIYVLRDLPGLRRFKIVQESLDLTRVLIEADPHMALTLTPTIIAGIKRRLGGSVRVEVERVDDIPKEASGKFRYIVSKVRSPVPSVGLRTNA